MGVICNIPYLAVIKIHADQIIQTKKDGMLFAYRPDLTVGKVYDMNILILGEVMDSMDVGVKIVERLGDFCYEGKITSYRFDDVKEAARLEGRGIL